MRLAEAGKLLAYISAYDNRSFNESVAGAWHDLLAEYEFEDCRAAVREHFTESSKWLMPADIIRRVKEVRKERLKAIGGLPRTNDVDSQRTDAHQLMKHIAKEVASGRMTRKQYEAYLAGNRPYEQARKEVEA